MVISSICYSIGSSKADYFEAKLWTILLHHREESERADVIIMRLVIFTIIKLV
jgi:hypothetical protein